MELSDPVNARRLGYTSRFFRSISLRYIYDVSSFVFETPLILTTFHSLGILADFGSEGR